MHLKIVCVSTEIHGRIDLHHGSHIRIPHQHSASEFECAQIVPQDITSRFICAANHTSGFHMKILHQDLSVPRFHMLPIHHNLFVRRTRDVPHQWSTSSLHFRFLLCQKSTLGFHIRSPHQVEIVALRSSCGADCTQIHNILISHQDWFVPFFAHKVRRWSFFCATDVASRFLTSKFPHQDSAPGFMCAMNSTSGFCLCHAFHIITPQINIPHQKPTPKFIVSLVACQDFRCHGLHIKIPPQDLFATTITHTGSTSGFRLRMYLWNSYCTKISYEDLFVPRSPHQDSTRPVVRDQDFTLSSHATRISHHDFTPQCHIKISHHDLFATRFRFMNIVPG